MPRAIEIAYFLLTFYDPKTGDLMSSLNLQRLLYYCQAAHLAICHKPLFSERMHAMPYGPITLSVETHFREYGEVSLTSLEGNSNTLTTRQKELLSNVHGHFGQFSASKLLQMTTTEEPFQQALRTPNRIITKSSLKTCFRNHHLKSLSQQAHSKTGESS